MVKNLSQLKRTLQTGAQFRVIDHGRPECVGEEREVIRLYKSMAQTFAKLPTWSYGILMSYDNFEHVFGKRSDKKRKLFNGQLLCHYYQYNGPKPPKKIN